MKYEGAVVIAMEHPEGNEVRFNALNVEYLRPDMISGATQVHFVSGANIKVRAPISEVSAAITNASGTR